MIGSRRIKIMAGRPGVAERIALAAGLLLLSALLIGQIHPAHAGDAAGTIELAFDLPAHSTFAADGTAKIEPVSQNVLAMQRGSGAAFALPLLPMAQRQPGVILWDEMKPPQNQSVSSPGAQSVNQINIQVR